ncbi:hypothetical protein BCV72DRAFT_179381, partial [Rhizopus microsporus var. microsporus]
PTFVLYVDPLSTINFELLVTEVKKHGNCSNGSFEKDIIELGKEIKLAIDKLSCITYMTRKWLGYLLKVNLI